MDASHSTKRCLTYSCTSEDEEVNPPTFEVVMTDSYINYDDLYIPRKFYKHLPPTVETALLPYRGKEWFVSMSVGDRRRFKEGWKLLVWIIMSSEVSSSNSRWWMFHHCMLTSMLK
uniref:Uncharacterized protein LOC104213936 n=1 Tax=Nicotiana sylvestris TaxID=4096 RepID=A0A1U7V9Z6_NICSY|nr:PREDICTED: uncharacterized protein LOC104213936 [Nicotiana sylvestris]